MSNQYDDLDSMEDDNFHGRSKESSKTLEDWYQEKAVERHRAGFLLDRMDSEINKEIDTEEYSVRREEGDAYEEYLKEEQFDKEQEAELDREDDYEYVKNDLLAALLDRLEVEERAELERLIEQERLEQEREQDRLEEQERDEQERLAEQERIDQDKLVDQERDEQKRLAEQETIDQDKLADQERDEQERLTEQERIDQDRLAEESRREEANREENSREYASRAPEEFDRPTWFDNRSPGEVLFDRKGASQRLYEAQGRTTEWHVRYQNSMERKSLMDELEAHPERADELKGKIEQTYDVEAKQLADERVAEVDLDKLSQELSLQAKQEKELLADLLDKDYSEGRESDMLSTFDDDWMDLDELEFEDVLAEAETRPLSFEPPRCEYEIEHDELDDLLGLPEDERTRDADRLQVREEAPAYVVREESDRQDDSGSERDIANDDDSQKEESTTEPVLKQPEPKTRENHTKDDDLER